MKKYTKQQEFSYQLSRLREKLKQSPEVNKLSQAQELIAQSKGFKNWHDFQAIYQHHSEYTQSKKSFEKCDKELYALWNTMLNNEDIIIIDLPIQNKNSRTVFTIEEIEKKQYLIFNKETKRLFSKKQENISLTEDNFPLLITGSSGSGKVELLNRICKTVIENGKGLITLDGIGYTRQISTNLYYAKMFNREDDVYILNLFNRANDYYPQSEKVKRKTNTINPLDSLLLNFNCFASVFGDDISKWLYPALKSYENKGKKVSLKSLGAFIKLPQIILMANSKEWNNQQEVISYLTDIGLLINDKTYSYEQQQTAILKHTVKSIKALEAISIIEEFIKEGVFSDNPEISLIDVFTNKRILSILFPTLEKTTPRYIFLKNIIHEMLISTDIYTGNKNTFIAFFENSNPHQFKANKINITWDFYGLIYELKSYLEFKDEGKYNIDKLYKLEEKDFYEYKTFFLMKMEDPEGLKLFKEAIINKFWGYQKLESFNKISTRDLKDFNEGQGYLISNKCNKISCEKIFVIYENLHDKEIFIKEKQLGDLK